MNRYYVDVRVGHNSGGTMSPRTENVMASSEREAREIVKGRMESMGYEKVIITGIKKG